MRRARREEESEAAGSTRVFRTNQLSVITDVLSRTNSSDRFNLYVPPAGPARGYGHLAPGTGVAACDCMGAINRVLERFGFVRIKDYGLALTADRRVVTTRKILDDGFGTHVVGYVSGDLAAIELAPRDSTERPAIPEPPIAFAPIVAPVVPPPPKPVEPSTCSAAAIAPEPPAIAPDDEPEDEWEWEIAAARAAAEAAPAPELTEDEWEWQIAAARARAEATNHFDAPEPARAAVVTPWRDDTAIRSVTQRASQRMSEPSSAPATPRTIIPVPTYQPATSVRLAPVRSINDATNSVPMPRRFPKATQPPSNDEDTAVRRVARR